MPTVGTGTDTLVVKLNEYQVGQDAQFLFLVNGTQMGGTQTCTVQQTATQTWNFLGNWGAYSTNTALVETLNTGYNNLYILGMVYDGTAVASSTQTMTYNGTTTYKFAQPTTTVTVTQTNTVTTTQTNTQTVTSTVTTTNTQTVTNSGTMTKSVAVAAASILFVTPNTAPAAVQGVTFTGTATYQ
jgi:hypothetical protein